MKNIILKHLELTNYRNIKHGVYEFDGSSKIVGDNRIGKTNTLESIYYLLTDSLLGGSNDIAEIKPREDTKATVRISAIFDIDGKEIEIGKEYEENWVKTRGTQETIFKGHNISYIFNGVKQSTIKEYNRLLADEFGITTNDYGKVNIFKMLIDPFYLGNMGESIDWGSLRTFIITLVGDIQDSDVFTKNPTLALIKNDLEKVGGRIDQLKKQFKQNADELNEKIIGLDAQIKMLEETPNATDEEIAIARKGKEDLQNKIDELKSNKGTDIVSKQVEDKIRDISTQIILQRETDLQIASLNPAFNKKNNLLKEQAEKQQSLNDIVSSKSKLMSEISYNEMQQSTLVYQIEECSRKRTDLLKQLGELDNEINNPDKFVQTTCPTCHREFETDKVDEIKQSFIKGKEDTKIKLIAVGKENKATKESKEQQLATLKIEHDQLSANLEKLDEPRKLLNADIIKIQEQIDNFVEPTQIESKKLADLKAQKVLLENELIESRKAYESGINGTNQAIYDIQEQLQPFESILEKRKYFEMSQDKLNLVKTEKADTSKLLIAVEQKTELVKTFIYTKLRMLDDNVSKVFGNIKFQLIKENINGGFDTICKPYIFNIDKNESTDVTWKSGSKSEKVITGIAIAECIKTNLGLPNLPYLFDEGGEISNNTFSTKFKTDSQIICVKVQDNIQKPMVIKI
jgi:DNA repair protein SbcC/Rad50